MVSSFSDRALRGMSKTNGAIVTLSSLGKVRS